ncbi:putative trehalose-phosphate phosphatase 2 [Castanea sativa]|uniref:putative trehalose-phosphate phosphatase 2 n=1 Tax=Castanea sativa TaxID=21020 RepID=UPI003F6528D9
MNIKLGLLMRRYISQLFVVYFLYLVLIGNDMVNFCPVRDFLPIIQTIKDKLEKIAKDIKGASVEDNKFCLSNVGKLKEMVESTMEFYNDFRISEGKKVMEICPIINWDKGRALQYLLDTLSFEDSSNMIKSIGRGFPVAVSTSPKETEALYSLRDPTEVMSFLILLAKWKMGCTF